MFWQGVAKRDLALTGAMFGDFPVVNGNSTGLKEHLDYYRPGKIQIPYLVPILMPYFPRIYMGKDMNQKVQSRYLQNGSLCTFEKYPNRIYIT